MPGLRDLTGGYEQPTGQLLMQVTEGFKRAGYDLMIRNEAWLRPGGILASDYLATEEGTRYRGALLIRLGRGEARAEVQLGEGARKCFIVRSGATTTDMPRIDKGILITLRDMVDKAIIGGMEPTLRLLR